MSNLPDYYKILNISSTATQDEVREGYCAYRKSVDNIKC
jgi:DnaJ-class molecular chaperone